MRFIPQNRTRSCLLCPVRVLRIYIEHSAPIRQSEQLFVSFGNHIKGHPGTKQRLSRRIVDAFILAYCSLGLQYPTGVRYPIPPEALPRLGDGLVVCPSQRFVRQPAEPRRPHLLGFTTWTSLACRLGSFLVVDTHLL